MSTDLDELRRAGAVDAAIAKLVARKDTYVFEEELLAAGEFVARYGTFGELFEEPGLTQAQFWLGERNAAWNLLGHWSVERNDPRPLAPPDFEQHAKRCQVCDYLEDVASLRTAFQHERCPECGLDLDGHDVGPDQIGKAHASCRTFQWERQEPLVGPGGEVAYYQVSDAFNARWTAPLTDGTFAVVTRTYYLAHNTDDSYRQSPGDESAYARKVPFVERQDEYVVCTDPADPGSTERGATIVYVEVESGDPNYGNPAVLAEQSFAPKPGEWQANAPVWARGLLPETAKA